MMNDLRESGGAGRSEDRDAINARLGEILPGESEQPVSLHGAMRHAVLSGGKRLRGMLCISSHRLFGDPEPASALEAASTYTSPMKAPRCISAS